MPDPVHVHLVDGTYELFRAHFGAPSATGPDGREVGATRGLLRSMWSMLKDPIVTHVGCAFDTVVESFRNQMFDGYKTGEGIEPELLAQFELAERALRALGMTVWSMIEFEADDALMSGSVKYGSDAAFAGGVERVVICSPDKDLAQAVRGDRIVCFDRRKREIMDDDGVERKFGVRPGSIPDWLGLVGDSADGIPGIPRWGAKSAAVVLARYLHIEAIPDDPESWDVKVRGAKTLAENLVARRDDAMLYRRLAVLRDDVPLEESLEDLAWRGADADALHALCAEIGFERFADEVANLNNG